MSKGNLIKSIISGAGQSVWGAITGLLSDQADLQGELDGKKDDFSENSAFNKNFGASAGTVAEGSALAAKADKTNVLELDNTTPFTPDDDHEPATKKYVDDNAGLGYTLVWGANMQTTGRYAQVNGVTSGGQETGLSPGSEYPVSADGTLDCLSYNTDTGDATTVFKIWKNGAVVHTFTATGASGFEEDIGLSVSRAAGDKIAFEYDAGMKPAGSVYVAYID